MTYQPEPSEHRQAVPVTTGLRKHDDTVLASCCRGPADHYR